MKIVIKEPQIYPPSIVNTSSGTYLMPGWHKLPEGTTLDEVDVEWTKWKSSTKVIGKFKSPRGRKYFTVKKNTARGEYRCNCSQYSFRKKTCPHIKVAKMKGH